MATLGEIVKKHRERLLEASDTFEDVLYAEAKASAKSPYGAIMTLKKAKGDLPDRYSGSKEDAITYNVVAKTPGGKQQIWPLIKREDNNNERD